MFRRLLFCGVWRSGDHHHSSEHKPLYQVEYRDIEDIEDLLYQEADEVHIGNVERFLSFRFKYREFFPEHVFVFCFWCFLPKLAVEGNTKTAIILLRCGVIVPSLLQLHPCCKRTL